MQTDKFLKFAAEREKFPSIYHRGTHEWSFYKFVAGLTTYIDYGCNFDKDGLCFKHRTDSSSKCCCNGCAYDFGYLHDIDYRYIKEYAKAFNEKDGFWTSNGCALPNMLRSEVCLQYRCISIKDRPNTTKVLWFLSVFRYIAGDVLSRALKNDLSITTYVFIPGSGCFEFDVISKEYKYFYNMYLCSNEEIEFIETLKMENRNDKA